MIDKLTKEEIEDIDYITCPLCEGIGDKMGILGNLSWYLCENCGTEFSIKIEGSDSNVKEQTD